MATSFKLPRKLRDMTQRRHLTGRSDKWATFSGRPTREDGSVDQDFIDKYPETGTREKAGYKRGWHQINGFATMGRREIRNEDARHDMQDQLRDLGFL